MNKISPIVAKRPQTLPLIEGKVPAGFPSPADDYLEEGIDLNEHLVSNPSATFMVRVSGESMRDAGIHPGDVLIVDRSVEASDGKIVIAIIDGQLTVKRLRKQQGQLLLQPENQDFPTLSISEEQDFMIWGVVTYIIHKAL